MDGARVQDSGFPADLGQPGDLQCSATGFDYAGLGLGLGSFECWDARPVWDTKIPSGGGGCEPNAMCLNVAEYGVGDGGVGCDYCRFR